MANTLAERVLEELNLRVVRENKLRDENLLLAVTPFPHDGVYQIQIAGKHLLRGSITGPFCHYVEGIITLPLQPQANVIDYLIQPRREGYTRTSQRGQNKFALAVTPFYDFDPSSLHPRGEHWRNAVRTPNPAGYEVRAAADTVRGVRYMVFDVPLRKEGEEHRILEVASSVFRKRDWKSNFPGSEKLVVDFGSTLKTPFSMMQDGILTRGERAPTMDELASLSVYADVRKVSGNQDIYPYPGMSTKAFSGGRAEFRGAVFRDALQKVVGTGPSKELQLLRAHFTYVPAGRADARETTGILYCA